MTETTVEDLRVARQLVLLTTGIAVADTDCDRLLGELAPLRHPNWRRYTNYYVTSNMPANLNYILGHGGGRSTGRRWEEVSASAVAGVLSGLRTRSRISDWEDAAWKDLWEMAIPVSRRRSPPVGPWFKENGGLFTELSGYHAMLGEKPVMVVQTLAFALRRMVSLDIMLQQFDAEQEPVRTVCLAVLEYAGARMPPDFPLGLLRPEDTVGDEDDADSVAWALQRKRRVRAGASVDAPLATSSEPLATYWSLYYTVHQLAQHVAEDAPSDPHTEGTKSNER